MTKIFNVTIRLDENQQTELDKVTTDIGISKSWFIRKAIEEKITRMIKQK